MEISSFYTCVSTIFMIWSAVLKILSVTDGNWYLLVIFCPFTLPPLKTQKIRILKIWKKIAGDIIILHKCTENYNHMRYSSWDTEWDRKFFLSFRATFCNFNLLATGKITIKIKNEKSIWKCHNFTHIYENHNYMIYASWGMEYDRHNFCHFGPFFALLHHYWPQK